MGKKILQGCLSSAAILWRGTGCSCSELTLNGLPLRGWVGLLLVTKLGLNLGRGEGMGHSAMVVLIGKMWAMKLGPVCPEELVAIMCNSLVPLALAAVPAARGF